MELWAAALALVLAALAAFLTVLAGVASRRFGERRFLLFGLAFGLVTAMAVLAVAAELDFAPVPWFDETFALGPVPLAILALALLLIYGAMMAPAARPRPSEGDGGP
ncbi:MAG TPA: hypothetical protein VN864_07460 [Thermoplasmata archaeon]|nr:hypothetical protein [Thermoplasmata archaeon]